jgi:hypothetical protein
MASADPGQPSDERDPAGADRVTPLERRSRWLLRAYPADYRRERGDEMIGTLLETTPDGRAWPRPRDVRALAMGSFRVRAAQNRRLSTTANLRIAVMAGLSFYLVLIAADCLGTWVIDPGPLRYEWRILALGLLILAAALPAWLAPRTIAAVSALATAVPIYLLGMDQEPFWVSISLLVCVAAIVLLVPRRARPPRTWLLLIGGIAVAVLASAYTSVWQLAPVLALCVISVAWVVIDARLVVAVATFVLTFEIVRMLPFFNAAMLPYMFGPAAIALLAAWLLRRQSAPRARSS